MLPQHRKTVLNSRTRRTQLKELFDTPIGVSDVFDIQGILEIKDVLPSQKSKALHTTTSISNNIAVYICSISVF